MTLCSLLGAHGAPAAAADDAADDAEEDEDADDDDDDEPGLHAVLDGLSELAVASPDLVPGIISALNVAACRTRSA